MELIQETRSWQRFNQLIDSRPFLREDWRSFINRPWVAGVVSALLSHREGAAMMAQEPDLGRAVRGVIHSVDAALSEDDLSWLVTTLDTIDHHSAIYTIMDAMEALVDADTVAALDELSRAAITPGRLAATADVAAAVLTPCAVRRRRTRQLSTPESEYLAGSSRGGKWGIENHRRVWNEMRRKAPSPSSPSPSSSSSCLPPSPFSSYDPQLPPSPSANRDDLPLCFVDQLVAALRHFWTRERIDRYLDVIEAVLPEGLPTLQALVAQVSALPNGRQAALDALNALERGIPAQRVAEVGSVLVGAMTPERVVYASLVMDAVMPPARMERYAGVLGEALTEERIAAIMMPATLDTLAAIMPQTPALRRAADAAAALARSPRAGEWEAALQAALTPERLAEWWRGLDALVSGARLGAMMDAAGMMLRPDRSLLRRIIILMAAAPAEKGPGTGGAAPSDAAQPASDAACAAGGVMGTTTTVLRMLSAGRGRPEVCPEVWDGGDLSAALGLADALLHPHTLGPLAALADGMMAADRMEALAQTLDRALPPLQGDGAAAGFAQLPAPSAPRRVPPFMRDLAWAAVRSGVAARSVCALARSVGEPEGAAAALRVVDAAAAPAGDWSRRLGAVPDAVRLLWLFHVQLLRPQDGRA